MRILFALGLLGLLGLLLWWGPHGNLGASYAPNLVSSLLELSIGGALVAWVVRWDRRRKLAPARDAALLLAERPLSRIVGALQASYVEAALAQPSNVPGDIEELMSEWCGSVPHLDLLACPTVASTGRWLDHIAAEFTSGAEAIQDLAARYQEPLGQRFVSAALQLEVDVLFGLLRELPRLAPSFQPAPAPALPQYFGFVPTPGPKLYEDFTQRMIEFVRAFDAISKRPFELDYIGWLENVAPFWGASRRS
jgi:hypothetical protein